jgi:hypothetical protein
MACAGALTSIVMTAVGAYLANGGAESIFGKAPVSSAAAPAPITNAVTSGVTTVGSNGVPIITSMGTAQGTVAATAATTSQSWYSSLTTTLGEMKDAVIEFTAPMREAWNGIASAPAAAGNEVFLQTVGTYGPATAQFLKSLTEGAFQTAISQSISFAGEALGGTGDIVAGVITGDPKKLGTIFSAAQSYASIANQFINAAEQGAEYLDKTFTNLDNTITAGVDGVSKWFDGLGDDIAEWGNTVSWDNLANLGSPGQLLANLEFSGTLGPMYDKLADITISEETAQQLGFNILTAGYRNVTGQQDGFTLRDLGVDLNTLAREGANLPPEVQKQIYEKLGDLSPTEVAQVKSILGNTQNAVRSGQDLLDPRKLLARSYTTVTTPVRTASVGFRAIYENDTGSVNPQLNNLGENLKGIIPDDLAVANAALARSLGQIKGIQGTGTDRFADAVKNLETLKDLPLLQNQTTYLDPAVAEWWRQQYNEDYGIKLGTGNLDTILLSDTIGFIAGYNSQKPLEENAQLMQELVDEGALDEFTRSGGIYQVIQEFSQGIYGPVNLAPDPMVDPPDWAIIIPSGYFEAGTYDGYSTSLECYEDVWLNVLIPAIVLENVSIVQNYPKAKTVYQNDITWTDQIGREHLNRDRIDLDASTVPASDITAINFGQNLPEIGKDTSFGGPAMFMERVIDINTLGGQATIAAMREGRNLQRIADAGVQQDAPINTEGLEAPGDLVPSTYTESEANALVIRS